MDRRFIYYALIALLFIALKLCYTATGNSDLRMLLWPASKIVALATNSPAVFNAATGYYHPALGIVIDRSCSGFNFLLICFVMLSVAAVPYFSSLRKAVTGMAVIMLFSYVLTCFVNTARILFALQVKRLFGSLAPGDERIVHEAEGVFVYVAFLIIVYLLFLYFIKRSKLFYAKPAQP